MAVEHWLVHGRVQGVGFRWYVRREARTLGLAGWVRNLSDGSVELVGAGTPEALAEFRQAVERGPVGSRVDRVEEAGLLETGDLPSPFAIR